jgi:hypothetical protein
MAQSVDVGGALLVLVRLDSLVGAVPDFWIGGWIEQSGCEDANVRPRLTRTLLSASLMFRRAWSSVCEVP